MNICNKASHVEKDYWFKGKPQRHNCKKFGHIQKYYQFKSNEQANYTEEKNGDGSTSYACQMAVEQNNDVWYIDSGCSNHMTGDESLFCKLDATNTTGNGAIVKSKSKGIIVVASKKGRMLIHEVLYASDLAQNLLSVVQLIDHGHAVHFEG